MFSIEGALSMKYIVTRWPASPVSATHQGTITVTVTALNHLEALEHSGLKEPGALISVNGQNLNIRYQVNSDGGIIKLAHYGSHKITD